MDLEGNGSVGSIVDLPDLGDDESDDAVLDLGLVDVPVRLGDLELLHSFSPTSELTSLCSAFFLAHF